MERKLISPGKMLVSIIFGIIAFGGLIYVLTVILAALIYTMFQIDLGEYKNLIILVISFIATWISVKNAFKKETIKREDIKKIMVILIIFYIAFFIIFSIPQYNSNMKEINNYDENNIFDRMLHSNLSKESLILVTNIGLVIGIVVDLANIFMIYIMSKKRAID